MYIDSQKKANAFAKKISRLFKDSGLLFPLSLCLEHTAKAAGFPNWQALVRSNTFPEIDEVSFYERLSDSLPFACRPTFNAWRTGEPTPEALPGYPARWFIDAMPYLMAAGALHRRTPLLAPGSGSGQKMRASIVSHLVLEWSHAGISAPLFDPTSFEFVFQGRPNDIFAEIADHPAFQKELDRLIEESIIKIEHKAVRLAPSDAEAVKSHAIWSRASKAKDWLENDTGGSSDALHEALSLIGVSRAKEIAEALMSYGDRGYVMASGPLRDVLNRIAHDGDLETFVHALNVFGYIFPGSASELRDAVPAKILNEFVARNRKVPITKAFRWMQANPDWADKLRFTAGRPATFTATVNNMVEQMRAA